jgi:parvulin-like peptidyl-prolyl isomerase
VKAQYEVREQQVNLEFSRFSTRRYEDDFDVTPAEVDAYVKAHQADLKTQYDERAFLYKKLDKQARLRHIVVELDKGAPADKVDKAKKQIEQAAAKVKAGAVFAEVAGQFTGELRTKKKGGLIGWKKKGFTGFGDELDKKVFAAKKGEVVGPERTDRGFELVLVEDFREGDVPIDVAEHEMAEAEVQKEKAKERAKSDAQAVLDRVKKGEKLESIVPKEEKGGENSALPPKGTEAPKLEETGLFSRRGEIVEKIGVSKDLARRAFQLKVGEVAGPFEASGSWVIVRAKEHKDPDWKEFDKKKDELQRDFERNKWAAIVDGWSKQRCSEVKADGRISVNSDVLAYDTPGQKAPAEVMKYEPCAARMLF